MQPTRGLTASFPSILHTPLNSEVIKALSPYLFRTNRVRTSV
jgi:hypothetical protein